MPEPKHPLKVFLCHASADKPKVRELYRTLKRRGIQPWLDTVDLIPGQNWEMEIPKALFSSDAIIICLSPNSVDKEGYVQKEIKFALDKAMEMPEGRIFLIPARLEECDLPYSLKQYQSVNLFEKDGYLKLMQALKLRASQLERITVQLPKTEEVAPIIERSIEDKKTLEMLDKQEISAPEDTQARKTQPKKTKPRQKPDTAIVVALIALAGTIIAALLGSPLLEKWFPSVPSPTVMVVSTTSAPLVLSATLSVTVEPTIRPSPTALPLEITDANNIKMVLVPVGDFKMGSADGPEFDQPVNIIYLNSFYIDKYEVSNGAYKVCVDANSCTPPKQSKSASRESYYGNSEFADYPVISINWYQADEYCSWRGGSLPSEEQWEKAARGENNFIYPWGNTFDPAVLNFCDKNCPMSWAKQTFDDGYEDTAPVSMFEGGQSPYGAYNMSGNVYEWTLDWYDVYPGGNSNADDGFGETSKVVRGGSWFDGDYMLRADHRFKLMPDDSEDILGFRCVQDIAK